MKRCHHAASAFLGFLVPLAAPPRASADTIVFRQGVANAVTAAYAGADDTCVASASPTHNFGGGFGADKVAYAGAGLKALLRFDLSAFAGGYSAIDGIDLSLDINFTSGGGTLSVHAVTQANAAWVEGSGAGAEVAGAASWNSRAHPATPWAGSAGLSAAAIDYDPVPLASAPAGLGRVTFHFTGTPAQLKALVDQWSGPQAQNAGLLVVCDAGTHAFRTSERFFPGFDILPPVLTLAHRPPLSPYGEWAAGIDWGTADGSAAADPDGDGLPNLGEYALALDPLRDSTGSMPAGAVQGGDLVMSFSQPAAIPGVVCSAESSATLPPGGWQPVADSGIDLLHIFRVPMGANPRLFLRLVFAEP